jgi:type IV pilus assembly protein PilV
MSVARPRRTRPNRSAGFSLIEVMVALVVTSIGLLGLAKMESLALSSTNVAGLRAIAAIEAASLAAAMHANPGYWAAGKAPATVTVHFDSSGVLQISDTGLATVPGGGCITAGTGSCAPGVMAAYDVQQWATDLKAALPASLATINCSTIGFPVSCTVQIQWTENAVAANAQQTNIGALAVPTYTLNVQP